MSESNDFTGQEVNGYKIIKPIGQGKFSTVFKAQSLDGEIVALKKIKIFDMMDPKQRDKCLKEVKLMQPLDHPNIIKYLDSFIFNNELMIVTEWAEKGDLKNLLKLQIKNQIPFEETRIWEYMYQVSGALNHMQEKRIMHRDLKPANIFINNNGELKVGDLGLGRVFSSETIEAYSKVGTPLYMSPELLHGEGYDMKSDVWSLGCVMYELCQFKSPFRDENEKLSLMELFTKITKGTFQEVDKRYSNELRSLLNAMIIVDPQKRIEISVVQQQCEQMLQKIKKSPKIDSVLVMEDIYEKLNLIDYHKSFCQQLGKKPISKLQFASNESDDNFIQFCELSYWIMSLQKKTEQKKNFSQLLSQIFQNKSLDQVAEKFIQDIISHGLRIPTTLQIDHIRQGCGDTVCFILNDLLNRELVRMNFQFQNFQIKLSNQEDEYFDDDPVIDQFLLLNIEDQNNISYQEEDQEEIYKIANQQDDINQLQQQQDEQILYSNVNLEEWKAEINRQNETLVQIQKSYNQINIDQIRFPSMVKHVKNQTSLPIKLIKTYLPKKIEEFTDELDFIWKNETKINQYSSHHTQELINLMDQKKKGVSILDSKCQSFDQKIIQYDQIQAELNKRQDLIKHLDEENDGNLKINKIKNYIQKLKDDIKSMNLKIALKNHTIIRRNKNLRQPNNNYNLDQYIDDFQD